MLRPSALLPLVAAALLTACAADQAEESSALAATPPAAGDSGAPATADSITVAAQPPADTIVRGNPFAVPTPDGAVINDSVVNVPVPAGRTKRDSIALARTIRAGMRSDAWPVDGPEVLPGSILPGKRIVAYYGNPNSKQMGALGEYEPDEMLRRLDAQIAEWRKADPNTPIQPALHMVTVVAQGSAGRDGKWRAMMDSAAIEKVYGWARSRNAILFLDIQTGQSTLRAELPRLMKWLERPDVHLGIDPEFHMQRSRAGVRPGAKIGTMDAEDINYVIRTLSDLVREKNLPPKVLVVHRFTRGMVTNASQIRLDPRVQVVMHMDGWGPPWLKYDSYRDYVIAEPVQYAGFKLFYKNDTKKGDQLLTPAELVLLQPKLLYIQYQ
ncbi:MAG TPA: hypothetical protein VGE02_16835 [Gemmatimonadales bacterium]